MSRYLFCIADKVVAGTFQKKIPSKLEVAPHALKMLSGVEWSGYPLDCYDY